MQNIFPFLKQNQFFVLLKIWLGAASSAPCSKVLKSRNCSDLNLYINQNWLSFLQCHVYMCENESRTITNMDEQSLVLYPRNM